METRIYEKALLEMDGIVRLVSAGNPFPLEPLVDLSRDIAKGLKEDSQIFEKVFNPRADIISHSVNVGIITIRIGQCLRYEEDELWLIGLGGFLHDLGMTALPEGLVTRPEKLMPEEIGVLRRHPEWSAEIVGNLGEMGQSLAGFIIQEHERLHGGGYPKGLKGDALDEYAQLIGIADVYEALTHPRPHRMELHSIDAIKEIVRAERDSFSRKILKVAIEMLPVYPAGSLVRLNTGAIGVVISNNLNSPFRPTIRILSDPEGKDVERGRITDLSENRFCWILSPYKEVESEK
jgi:HD-GYP domain-containing protein (c-di-GMP phosphodiesterase class II)